MTCISITLRLCCVFEKRSQLDQNCKTLPNMGFSWFRSLQVNNFRLDWNDKWQGVNHGWHCQQGNRQKEKHKGSEWPCLFDKALVNDDAGKHNDGDWLPPLARRAGLWRRPASSPPSPRSTRSTSPFPSSSSSRFQRCCQVASSSSGCWFRRPLAAPSSPRPPSRRPKHEKHALYTWCNPTNKNHKLSARLPGRTELGWWVLVLVGAWARTGSALPSTAAVTHRGARARARNQLRAPK